MSFSVQFDYLPSNVLSLSGYDFFQFIRNTLGEPEANLLCKISVRTTSSFLLVENPLDIFNEDIEDEELEKLKDQLCFKMKNDKYMIKPGVLAGFLSLKQSLKDKLNQQQTSKNKRKKQQLDSNAPSTFSSTLATQPATTSSLSIDAHHSYVLRLIKNWCVENQENLGLESFALEEGIDFTVDIHFEDIDFTVNIYFEGTDYTLKIYFDDNSTVHGSIKCKCGKLISLSNNGEKVQVSNYYKHLLSLGCSYMKQIKKKVKQVVSSNHQQLPTSISVLRVPSSPLDDLAINVSDDEVPGAQRVSHGSVTQIPNVAKRRLLSQSQHTSNKRTRK